jgi:predicted enzyme related to lactoylglutathione lyase
VADHLSLIEFPADDPARARRFWSELLGVELKPRTEPEGQGWQTQQAPAVGVHERGRGPGDTFSLPYFTDSEGTPFGLAAG